MSLRAPLDVADSSRPGRQLRRAAWALAALALGACSLDSTGSEPTGAASSSSANASSAASDGASSSSTGGAGPTSSGGGDGGDGTSTGSTSIGNTGGGGAGGDGLGGSGAGGAGGAGGEGGSDPVDEWLLRVFGNDNQQVNDVAVGGDGSVYIVGTTRHQNTTLEGTFNPPVPPFDADGDDIFAAKLSPDGMTN